MPPLAAAVHSQLTEEEISSFDVQSSVVFRNGVLPHELEEIQRLHTEWFPVEYNEEFFRSITTDPDVLTIVAELRHPRATKIVGLATVGIRRKERRFNADGDLLPFLGSSEEKSGIAYIFTLGVVDELRQRGLASALLGACVRQIEITDPFCPVVFLHVIEYNKAAMKLYLKNGFKEFKTEPQFYRLGETWYSGVMFYRPLAGATTLKRLANWVGLKLTHVL